RRIGWSNLESFPDRVFPRPVPFGETAVDNGDGRRVRSVVRFKKASTLKWNAHRAEVVRTDNAKERERQVHITRRGTSLDREAEVHAIKGERQKRDHARGFNAGNFPNLPQHLIVKSAPSFLFRILRKRQ